MQVSDKARRSVVFIGNKDDDGIFHARATAFLVAAGTGVEGTYLGTFLVTAEHNVVAMQQKGWAIHIRVNLKNGAVDTAELPEKWWFHPGGGEDGLLTDVAALPIGLQHGVVAHDFIPLLQTQIANYRKPRLGDEVAVMGLFKSHYGKRKNIPVVRIGTIAALPEEPVWTKYAGDVDALLVEMKSIAGLSGSPAFITTHDESAHPKGFAMGLGLPDPRFKPPDLDEVVRWWDWQLLGLIHGHYDVESLEQDDATDDIGERERSINAGIAIVIPVSKIMETLLQPNLIKLVEDSIKKEQQKRGATPDFDSSEKTKRAISSAPATDNPSHKEDFMNLLGAAAKANKPNA